MHHVKHHGTTYQLGFLPKPTHQTIVQLDYRSGQHPDLPNVMRTSGSKLPHNEECNRRSSWIHNPSSHISAVQNQMTLLMNFQLRQILKSINVRHLYIVFYDAVPT